MKNRNNANEVKIKNSDQTKLENSSLIIVPEKMKTRTRTCKSARVFYTDKNDRNPNEVQVVLRLDGSRSGNRAWSPYRIRPGLLHPGRADAMHVISSRRGTDGPGSTA